MHKIIFDINDCKEYRVAIESKSKDYQGNDAEYFQEYFAKDIGDIIDYLGQFEDELEIYKEDLVIINRKQLCGPLSTITFNRDAIYSLQRIRDNRKQFDEYLNDFLSYRVDGFTPLDLNVLITWICNLDVIYDDDELITINFGSEEELPFT
jgi:hypothetical protein